MAQCNSALVEQNKIREGQKKTYTEAKMYLMGAIFGRLMRTGLI